MDTKIINELLNIFHKVYNKPKIELNYSNPFELLIATILSAQCTDKRVNEVTENLFKKLTKIEDFVQISTSELEELIKPTGFYKNKAKSIKNCCKTLIEKYNCQLPDNVEELSKLPGVGRKTANVLLVECFNKPAIVVDTHVKRFSRRFGLTKEINPEKIEYDLMKIIPESEWNFFSKSAVLHGRYICKSRKPDCEKCPVNHICLKIFNN